MLTANNASCEEKTGILQTFYSQTNKNLLIVKPQTVQLLGQDLYLATAIGFNVGRTNF